MSFPNIPDINPYINIKFEDAINLLLTSVAMEEMSVSKLIEAETQKKIYVTDDCKHRYHALNDRIKINKSVDETIKNLIKLQMLLQFKLAEIKEILSATSTTTTTTSTSTTTTSTTLTCSTTTKKECCCSLVGNGKGCVSNCCDEFHFQTASLSAFLSCRDYKNRTLRYTVENKDTGLRLYTTGYNIKMKCPCHCSDSLVIFGKGQVEKRLKHEPDITGSADFILTVRKKADDSLEFRMEIRSGSNADLNHDSGFIQVKRALSDKQLSIYR